MRKILALWLLLIAALAASPVLAAGPCTTDPASATGSWSITCAPDDTCAAAACAGPQTGVGMVVDYILAIGRPAQQTYWEVSFTPIAIDPDETAPFTASVDGKATTFDPPAGVAAFGSANSFFFLGAGAQQLLDRLPLGKSIDVSFTDWAGTTRTATFPLAGLSTVLIAIDKRQRRIGSERVTGPAPYGLPPIPPPALAWAEPALNPGP